MIIDADSDSTDRARQLAGVSAAHKTFAILEIIAERGGLSAREVSDALDYPLPTVYRLIQTLTRSGYIVHLKDERKYGLGYKIQQLAISLHKQIGVSGTVRAQIGQLHENLGVAAYFAIYRGGDVIVAYVADCPDHPRLIPLNFGLHEAAHATAFGKILLNGMSVEQRSQYLDVHSLIPITPATIVEHDVLAKHLETVGIRGIAWEVEEFVGGMTCAAIGVRNSAGFVIGSVAISAPTGTIEGRERDLEKQLRETSAAVSRHFRMRTTGLAP